MDLLALLWSLLAKVFASLGCVAYVLGWLVLGMLQERFVPGVDGLIPSSHLPISVAFLDL